ncbi:MAG TPA: presqualene diphosphate synthase HpnD [Candidatus Kapabacteria bacterium]|nr:presqualene diphosphate synthase HpnD [Candidatus Kapabacteria bacterium]
MTLSLATPKRSNFLYSFTLLPKREREAMHRIYDFCRYTDDLVDENSGVLDEVHSEIQTKRVQLALWREEVDACYHGTASHPILRGLKTVLDHFEIPKEYLLALIGGVEMDLVKTRYETFEELREYCYAVASTVGLISIQVFGYKHEETRDYAVNLGYALQLTNILRDIKQDASNGRIYLPLEDLRAFNYDEKSLMLSRYDERFIALMKFETDRARDYYAKARSLLQKDERHALFAAEIMDAIYFRLLRKIERADYDVFSKRISVTVPHKLLLAFRFWANRFFRSAR